MRVLLVSDYGNRGVGGAEGGLANLRDGLRARGIDARLLASTALSQRDQGLGEADYYAPGTTSRWRGMLQSANPGAAATLARVMDEFRPDVVHVNLFLTQLSPLILPVLRGVPALYHACWFRTICLTGLKLLPDGQACRNDWGRACLRCGCVPVQDWVPLMMQMALWRRWRGVFRQVVAVSDMVRSALEAEDIGPVKVIRYGVPTPTQRPPLPDAPLVAFAGRFVPTKGIETLLRAFALARAQVPAARLLLVGDGPERQASLALASDLGVMDAVEAPGYLPRAEIDQRFARAWVQVVPSQWDEPFPLAGIESMMRGTALVASRVGGMPELVREGETGYLFPRGDVDALSERLVTVLRDRSLADRLGQRGREIALAEYTIDAFTDAFLATYREMLEA